MVQHLSFREVDADFQVRAEPFGCGVGADLRAAAGDQHLERKVWQQLGGWLLHRSKQAVTAAHGRQDTAPWVQQRTGSSCEPKVEQMALDDKFHCCCEHAEIGQKGSVT